MTDRLPDGAVEAAWWALVHEYKRAGYSGPTRAVPELVLAAAIKALPPGTVIVVREDGQVTCRTQEEARRVAIEAFPIYGSDEECADAVLAALSATDTEKDDA